MKKPVTGKINFCTLAGDQQNIHFVLNNIVLFCVDTKRGKITKDNSMRSPGTIHDVLKLIVMSLINCQAYDEIHIGMAICYMQYTSAIVSIS